MWQSISSMTSGNVCYPGSSIDYQISTTTQAKWLWGLPSQQRLLLRFDILYWLDLRLKWLELQFFDWLRELKFWLLQILVHWRTRRVRDRSTFNRAPLPLHILRSLSEADYGRASDKCVLRTWLLTQVEGPLLLNCELQTNFLPWIRIWHFFFFDLVVWLFFFGLHLQHFLTL